MSVGQFPGAQAFLTWTDLSGTNNILTFDVVVSEDWDQGTTITEHPVEQGADISDHVRVKLVKCDLKIRATNEPMNDGGPDAVQSTKQALQLSVPTVKLQNGGSTTLTVREWQSNILERALATTAGGAVGNAVGGQVGGAIGALAVGLLFDGKEKDVSVATDAGLGDVIPKQTTSITAQTYQFPGNGTDFVEAVHALLVQLKNAAQVFQVNGSKQIQPNMVIEDLTMHRDAGTGTGEDITIGFKEVRLVATQTVTLPIPNLSAGGGAPPAEHGQQELADAAIADTPQVAAMHAVSLSDQLNVAGITVPGLGP